MADAVEKYVQLAQRKPSGNGDVSTHTFKKHNAKGQQETHRAFCENHGSRFFSKVIFCCSIVFSQVMKFFLFLLSALNRQQSMECHCGALCENSFRSAAWEDI